jgi:hypothetical protein
VTAVDFVDDTNVTEVAATPPKVAARLLFTKLVPLIVTFRVPAVGPMLGTTLETIGAWACAN